MSKVSPYNLANNYVALRSVFHFLIEENTFKVLHLECNLLKNTLAKIYLLFDFSMQMVLNHQRLFVLKTEHRQTLLSFFLFFFSVCFIVKIIAVFANDLNCRSVFYGYQWMYSIQSSWGWHLWLPFTFNANLKTHLLVT